jgi:hypothetical protein
MKIHHRVLVSQLSDLPIFKTIKIYQKLNFNVMTKEELIDFIPSEASMGWTKPKILEETNKAYNYAKQYFAKYTEGLSRLRSGQLCLIGKNPDTFISDQPVYLLTGLGWLHYVDKSSSAYRSCVSCKVQELRITTLFNSRDEKVHCYRPPCYYGDDEVIFPMPQKYLELDTEVIENFKKALDTLTPIVPHSL